MPLYDFRCEEGHRFERAVPLARFAEAQECDCGASARRILSAPRVLSDTIAPILGMDGRIHDSLSGYRHSLTPSGNARGERYYELGDQELPEFKAPEFSRKERRDAIRAGMADVKAGRVAPPVTGEPA